MPYLLCLWFLLVLAPLPIGHAAPRSQPAPYVLENKPAKAPGFSIVTLRNRRTGRAVWQRRILDFKDRPVRWSKDRRALVIDGPFALLVWREAKPLLEVAFPVIPGSKGRDHYDYLVGQSILSPDGQRVLARFGISGMASFDAGRLFCFTLRGNGYKTTFLPSGFYVKDMKWHSNRVASYRPFLDNIYQVIGRRRLWRVP